MRVAIQVDDLTGACDTGAVLAEGGLPTVVLLPEAGQPTEALEVLVLDTESRRLLPAEAEARARAAAARLLANGPAHLYKKLDSTLRGPVAAEWRGCWRGRDAPGP